MTQGTWIQEAIRGLTWAYGALFIVAVALALLIPKRPIGKLLWTIGVVAVFSVLPVRMYSSLADAQDEAQRARADHEKKLKRALALFEERCRSAGEKIHRTVDNVDGVVWMKWRPKSANLEYQYTMDDPYGSDCGGEGCILQLLRVTRDVHRNPEDARRHSGLYRFVESSDPADARRYRYTAAMKLSTSWTEEGIAKHRAQTGQDPPSFAYRASLEREPVETFTARYGITWDDLSTQEDRQHWIAGGSLKVVDLKTGEVIAERVGFMIDRGQGSRAGSRAPWGLAKENGCPPLIDHQGRRANVGFTNRFSHSVLKPTKGE